MHIIQMNEWVCGVDICILVCRIARELGCQGAGETGEMGRNVEGTPPSRMT